MTTKHTNEHKEKEIKVEKKGKEPFLALKSLRKTLTKDFFNKSKQAVLKQISSYHLTQYSYLQTYATPKSIMTPISSSFSSSFFNEK
jgi:hypothetical protein